MDAENLDYQCRTFKGWVHPELVKLLIERGHEDEVRRAAGQGDWFCARGLAGEAGELDRRGEREAWEETWRLQWLEGAGENVGQIRWRRGTCRQDAGGGGSVAPERPARARRARSLGARDE